VAKFTAVVRKKTTFRTPVLNSAAKPLLVGLDGKELLKDEKTGLYIGTGTQRFESTTTDSTDDPLTDEAGNPIEAGTVEALLRKIKEHFGKEENENVEILKVSVQEIKTIQEFSGAELTEVK
jgi:hypothetical protein